MTIINVIQKQLPQWYLQWCDGDCDNESGNNGDDGSGANDDTVMIPVAVLMIMMSTVMVIDLCIGLQTQPSPFLLQKYQCFTPVCAIAATELHVYNLFCFE